MTSARIAATQCRFGSSIARRYEIEDNDGLISALSPALDGVGRNFAFIRPASFAFVFQSLELVPSSA